MVVQISRGLCPGRAIAEAAAAARLAGLLYEYVDGLPLVEAKNRAVEIAMDMHRDMILIEDDILASPKMWRRITADEGREEGHIMYTDARCNGGSLNTHYDRRGNFLYSGTCLIRVPYTALRRLERPIFRAWDFGVTDEGLTPRGENAEGSHSDVYFWWSVSRLDPKPRIVNLGEVTHLKHPLNSGKQNHRNPTLLEAW